MVIIPDPVFAAVMTLPFAVTVGALYVLLFKPYFEYLEGREGAIDGARHEAEAMSADSAAKLDQLEAALADARARAAAIRAEQREAGLAYERQVVDAARTAAAATLDEALQQIADEATQAADAMRETSRTLSSDIAGRILGRSVEA